MPLELIADSPGSAIVTEYEEKSPETGEIRVRSLFSAVKHGTEFRRFQSNSSDATDRWDWDLRLHVRGETGTRDSFPFSLGNMVYGEVEEVGDGVDGFKEGDRVFAHAKVSESHIASSTKFEHAPDGVSPEALMYSDPAGVAVGGIRDGGVRVGDRVAVFGLGAIGQMQVQVARASGARWVAAIDPIDKRRVHAERHGADLVLDPTQVDVGLEIKQATGGLGVDVGVEGSGNARALNDALRSTKYQGTIVSTAYYIGAMDGLFFSGEWHRNRIRIVASRSDSEPHPDFGWSAARTVEEAFALLAEGKLKVDGLFDPVVPMRQAATAYMHMNTDPEEGLKLGIDHTLS